MTHTAGPPAVATEPAHRHRGHARAASAALLKHLQREGATLDEMQASADAVPLYEGFGCTSNPGLMRMTKLPQAREGGAS
ncbi:GNAT family N-acetyltransferase [Streptomyces sp. NPDC056527]|uniref:GNAT family N-acetyltransferase n=1 Tax=Streptomyces sp. NPDC056527 TaxID=3345853 RepID=UPI00369878AE